MSDEGEFKKRILSMDIGEEDAVRVAAILEVLDEAKKEIFEINCLVCQEKPLFKGLPCFKKAEGSEMFTRFCPWLMNAIVKYFGEVEK